MTLTGLPTERGAPEEVERALQDAISRGCLRVLSPEARKRLFHTAIVCHYSAGCVLTGAGADGVPLGMVVHGRLRQFIQSEPDRQQAVGYLGPGALFGASVVFGLPSRLDLEALTPVRLVRFSVAAVRRLTPAMPDVATAFAEQLARDNHAVLTELQVTAFTSMRRRVAHHLLMRADVDGDMLRMTQRELAQAVGSVREVVGRILIELETAGLIRRTADGVIAIDRDRLQAVKRVSTVRRRRRAPDP